MSSAFVDTHNMVAILTKSDASEGFDQILKFLNGSYIKYALTVNPHIYVSCIKQFWNTVTVKQSADVTRLQALVDKKKVVISKAVIRDVLRLDDAKGVDCLPNEGIFTGLARMGDVLRLDDAEGVDCLPNKQIFTGLARIGYEKPSTKLTIYKAFFSSQWKFLIHTILQSLSAKCTSWNEFSSAMASAIICLVETPLFEGMIVVQENVVEGIADEQVQDDVAVTTAPEDALLLLKRIFKHKLSHRLLHPPHLYHHKIFHPHPTRIENLEHDKVAQNIEITKLKTRVKKPERENKVKTLKLGRLRKVGTSQMIESSDDTIMEDVVVVASAPVSVASIIIPAAETNILAATITAALVKVAVASTRRRRRVVIRDPEEESSAKTSDEIKSKDKAQKAAKRRRLNQEDKDVEEIKQHLEIMTDEDDDVYTEATPLARKSQRSVHGQAMVKIQKLLTLCGVHIISFTTTQLILLVERRYPLLRFTLEQMINVVRLQVEEQSEMSLELIRSLKKNTKYVNAASEELSAIKHKLMLLDTAAERS
nr:hypothetical protein [Tanacetum cinerariifolium]